MRTQAVLTLFLVLITEATPRIAQAQGNFQNLDFESANLAGFSPHSEVPTSNALPSWSVFYSNTLSAITFSVTTVWYDDVSLGGYAVSIDDINNASGIGKGPFDGQYRVALFGGMGIVSTTISQTGLVPVGTLSLQAKYSWYQLAGPPVFALNGQSISMTPLALFPYYALYGGDVSSFAGQTATLSITAPPGGPSMVFLDSIAFSTQAVPEPSVVGLSALGVGLLGWVCRKRALP